MDSIEHSILRNVIMPLPAKERESALAILNATGMTASDLVDTIVNSPGGAAQQSGCLEWSPGFVAFVAEKGRAG